MGRMGIIATGNYTRKVSCPAWDEWESSRIADSGNFHSCATIEGEIDFQLLFMVRWFPWFIEK